MDGLPRGLPALQRAQQMQQKAARVGFDWGSLAPVVDKVREETEELAQVAEDPIESEAELGDLLFAVVNLARNLGVDPEVALRRASGRFEERFRRMEGVADLTELDLDQMDHLWNNAKDE